MRAAEFDVLALTWTRPAGADGYDLEARAGAEPWGRVLSGMPRDAIGATVQLRPETPELVQLSFRVRATRGGATSPWTEAAFLRGIRPPTNVKAVVAKAPDGVTNAPPVTVTWTNQSSAATALQLERAPAKSDGSPVFSALPAEFAAQAFLDRDPIEATPQTYRIRYGAAGVWSDWAEATLFETVDLIPARDLAVTPLPGGGVKVAWRPRSLRADLQRLARWSFGPGNEDFGTGFTDLPADASEYVDPIASYFPVLRYQVRTVRTAYFPSTVSSEIAVVAPYTVPGPPSLAASGPFMPRGESFARDAAGRIHLATQGSGSQAKVLRARADGWDELPLDGFEMNQGPPRLALDAQGRLHALYVREVPGTDPPVRILTHARDDGAAWQREDVPLAPPDYGTAYWLGVESDGAVHVAVLRFPAGAQLRIDSADRDASGWTEGTIPPSDLGFQVSASFASAPDGTAYQLVVGEDPGSSYECRLRVRMPGAGWGSEESVPGCTARGAWLLPANGGRVAVVHGAPAADAGDDLYVARRSAEGGFAAPEYMVHRPHSGAELRVAAASSSDGARAAVILSVLDPTGRLEQDTLVVSRVNGAGWDRSVLGPSTARAWALGFDVGDKLWALGSFSLLDEGLVPYALYLEP